MVPLNMQNYMLLHCGFHCEKTGKTEVSNNISNNKNTGLAQGIHTQ